MKRRQVIIGPCEPLEGPRLLLLRWEQRQSSQKQNDKRSALAAMLGCWWWGEGRLKIKAGRPIRRVLHLPGKRDGDLYQGGSVEVVRKWADVACERKRHQR